MDTTLPVLQPKDRLCITLDGFDLFSDSLEHNIRTRLNTLFSYVGSVRCKYELFYSAHFDLITLIKRIYGLDILMDLNLKYMDEDNVRDLSYTLLIKGVDIFNISADSPQNIINSVIQGAEKYSKEFNKPRPKIFGIISGENKKELALEVVKAGLDGIVCSYLDLESIKPELPKNFIFVTTDDTDGIVVPDFALKAGYDLLVVGRSIYKYETPNDQLKAIREINELIKKSI